MKLKLSPEAAAGGEKGRSPTVEELQKQNAAMQSQLAALESGAQPTEREKKIRRRMTAGQISHAAAALAVDHQDLEDRRQAEAKLKIPKNN
jgi:hypothetical protein